MFNGMNEIRISRKRPETMFLNFDYIMRELLNNASIKSRHDRFKHSCAIVARNGKIVKISSNRKGLCAERSALKSIPSHYDPSELCLIVVRVNRSGRFANSMPCRRCCKAIVASGIPVVIYTTQNCEYSVLNDED